MGLKFFLKQLSQVCANETNDDNGKPALRGNSDTMAVRFRTEVSRERFYELRRGFITEPLWPSPGQTAIHSTLNTRYFLHKFHQSGRKIRDGLPILSQKPKRLFDARNNREPDTSLIKFPKSFLRISKQHVETINSS